MHIRGSPQEDVRLQDHISSTVWASHVGKLSGNQCVHYLQYGQPRIPENNHFDFQ